MQHPFPCQTKKDLYASCIPVFTCTNYTCSSFFPSTHMCAIVYRQCSLTSLLITNIYSMEDFFVRSIDFPPFLDVSFTAEQSQLALRSNYQFYWALWVLICLINSAWKEFCSPLIYVDLITCQCYKKKRDFLM